MRRAQVLHGTQLRQWAVLLLSLVLAGVAAICLAQFRAGAPPSPCAQWASGR